MKMINKSSTSMPRGYREFATLALVLSPIVFLAALFAFGLSMELRAASQVKTQLAMLNSQGLYASNHEVTVAADQRTSRENAARWQDVLLAASQLESRFYPLRMSVGDLQNELVSPDETWEVGPVLTKYAQQGQPTILLIEDLLNDPQPFWRPIRFEGFSTLLDTIQNSRLIQRLLTVEFRVAVHDGDHQRAMRVLRLMVGVSNAFDWDVVLIGRYVQFANIAQHRQLIQQSLTVGFWNQSEHLSELRDQLAEQENLDEHWQRINDAESSMMLTEIFGDLTNDSSPGILSRPAGLIFPFGLSPIVKQELLSELPSRSFGLGVGTNRHVRQVANAEKSWNQQRINGRPEESHSSSLVAIPFGNLGFLVDVFRHSQTQHASANIRFEFDRRITLTAVAIKQFQLQENRWPEKLSELTAVGLSASQWSVEPGIPIGYRISDDNQSITLWAAVDREGAVVVPDAPVVERGTGQYIWNVSVK